MVTLVGNWVSYPLLGRVGPQFLNCGETCGIRYGPRQLNNFKFLHNNIVWKGSELNSNHILEIARHCKKEM